MKFLAFVLLFISNIAFAQNSEEYEKGFKAGQDAQLKPAQVVETATEEAGKSLREKLQGEGPLVREESIPSEVIRAEKSHEVAISWGQDYKIVTTQLILSKYLAANEVIGFKFGYGTDHRGNYHDTQLNISFQYKRFLSNSFYVSPEVTYLKFEQSEDNYYPDQDNEFYRGFGIGFRIGNQWHFENFIIGCDWVGLGKLLVATEDTDNLNSYATLLNTYIGCSF